MPLNEADTRAQLIDPKLSIAGWTRTQVTREQYYLTDWIYTAGRVVLRGERAERLQPRRVDYVLRYTDSFPLAIVEAKDEGKPAVAGLEQAKRYARELGLMFAYATNGHEIIEWDNFTNTSTLVESFPSPSRLWDRWCRNIGIEDPTLQPRLTNDLRELRPLYSADDAQVRRRNPLLHPYAPEDVTRGKIPHYYQETAIREILLRIIRGQRRILLTMATGTGKTHTAVQLMWKLLQSGWLTGRQSSQQGRMLFLADRVILRDQAYNAFSPFASGASEPRFLLDGQRPLSLNRDLYFGIYQTLWNENDQGKRLFELFPPNFFDVIIIDEAHRSGFGTWRDILDHFTSAIQLGMTATPKQDENIDTYAYFCAEEVLTSVNPDNPDGDQIRQAAYTYSLGQGIEDGFLATYKIHRVRTSLDRDGFRLQDAIEQGAEIVIPNGVEPRDHYLTPQFEREIRLPDRTKVIVNHLSQRLRLFGPLQKTMVFCVDMEHAQEVARQLNNEFADLGYGDNYAVPIVSEEGDQGRRWLSLFQDSDRQLPVVATTAELLSTGVDVPSARNIVFMKTVASPIVFKQIIGRGTRIDSSIDKLWFRIIDYTGATHLLDPYWDHPPSAVIPSTTQPMTSIVTGTVTLAGSGNPVVGAAIAIQVGPNDQRGPILSDANGCFSFTSLPASNMTLVASKPGLHRRQISLMTEPNLATQCAIELKPIGESAGKIEAHGLHVAIADEATFIVEGMNEPMTLERYLDYSRSKIIGFVSERSKLQVIWQDPTQRRVFIEQLSHQSVHLEVLADIFKAQEADQFDLLSHLAYRTPLQTRVERATAFHRREQAWLAAQSEPIREVIIELLAKYELGGLNQISDPSIFRVSPFREMGEVRGVIARFGDAQRLRETIDEIQRRLYAA
ncbi:type III restriction protein res subunit (plasmid) [Herpetosiphon aurantiacus DSM 785]|uniref:Type III restriction protein res subunit n=1 Tax=Herpetosiphon aurantiacus (strain ATCC 23779 / DSM 785 / 114-95) TaxID=316274 RepID=A9B991_HERA2|nr:type III restriction protein res subunit [Herpetosiphon aurantiacus DSM 785]